LYVVRQDVLPNFNEKNRGAHRASRFFGANAEQRAGARCRSSGADADIARVPLFNGDTASRCAADTRNARQALVL